jgi:ATPase subunit of ABC transporter with duplicated ATPase domains
MEVLTPPLKLPKPNFRLTSTTPPNSRSLEIKKLTIGYDGRALLPEISFELGACEKIAITGFNGIGKSTFLKTLIGLIPAVSGDFTFAQNVKLAYLEQDLVWEDNTTPMEIIADRFPKMSVTEVRKTLAEFGVHAKHVSQNIKTLSGGEQTRVKLCILANTKSNFLLLDEPTNHMDDVSKDVLREQLTKWKGAFILVSHDTNFYQGLVDRIVKFEKTRNHKR